MNNLSVYSNFFILVSFVVTAGIFFFMCTVVAFVINYIKKKVFHRLELDRIEHRFQKQLLAASITSQEQERKRMATDLHDDIGPLLSLANLYLDAIGEQVLEKGDDDNRNMFAETRKLLNAAIDQARRITFDMCPYDIEMLGLRRSIARLLEQLKAVKTINISLYVDQEDFRLETEQEVMAFRVVKETLNNIIKHSAASFIHLSQYVKNDQFIIEISHDGKGLDQASFERLLKEHKGMGLKNISSRLQACNGQVTFFMQEKVYFASFSIPMQPKGIIMVEE